MESSAYGFSVYLFCPDVFEVEVAGDDDLLGSDLSHLSELVFCHEGLVLADFLEDAEHECFILLKVVDEDHFLVGVPVPVLGLVFFVVVWVLCCCHSCFAYSRFSVDPVVVEAFQVVHLSGAVEVEVYVALDSAVVFDGDQACFEGLLGAHGDEVFVAAGKVSLDIEPGRFDSEGPGSF